MAGEEVPDGEGFEFGVGGPPASLVFVVEHGEAGGQFAAAGAGGGHHDERAGGGREGQGAVAVGADDVGEVVGIAGDGRVGIDAQAAALEFAAELLGGGPAFMAGDDDGGDLEA